MGFVGLYGSFGACYLYVVGRRHYRIFGDVSPMDYRISYRYAAGVARPRQNQLGSAFGAGSTQGKVKVLMARSVVPMPALVVIVLWIVLQFFSGIGSIANTADTGGVAYMAHIGGFIAGFVLTFLFGGSRRVPALTG